jgi:hypothetical protein
MYGTDPVALPLAVENTTVPAATERLTSLNKAREEAIIAHRKQGRQTQYLVKWKGYNSSENTWLFERDLLNAGETLANYKL